MKKAAKILIAAGAAVLVLAGAAYYFGGELYYRKAQEEFSLVLDWSSEPWAYADKGTFSDGRELLFDGFRVTVPDDLDLTPKKMAADAFSYKTEYDADGKRFMVFSSGMLDMGEFMLSEVNITSKQRFEKYLHSIGREMPQNWSDMFRLCYTLKPEDCDRHNLINAHYFYLLEQFMGIVDSSCFYHYLVDTPTAVGNAAVTPPFEGENNYNIRMDLFLRSNPNSYVYIIISAPDLDSAVKIANSVEMGDYKASEVEEEPVTDEQE